MEYGAGKISFEGLIMTLPIIILAILWCSHAVSFINIHDEDLTTSQKFHRDTFLIFYSFITSWLIYLIFQYGNIDRGWWVFGFYCICAYALIFSLYFALTSMIIKNHRLYSLIFSIILFFGLLASCLFPFKLSGIWPLDCYLLMIIFMAIVHLLIYFNYKMKILCQIKMK